MKRTLVEAQGSGGVLPFVARKSRSFWVKCWLRRVPFTHLGDVFTGCVATMTWCSSPICDEMCWACGHFRPALKGTPRPAWPSGCRVWAPSLCERAQPGCRGLGPTGMDKRKRWALRAIGWRACRTELAKGYRIKELWLMGLPFSPRDHD